MLWTIAKLYNTSAFDQTVPLTTHYHHQPVGSHCGISCWRHWTRFFREFPLWLIHPWNIILNGLNGLDINQLFGWKDMHWWYSSTAEFLATLLTGSRHSSCYGVQQPREPTSTQRSSKTEEEDYNWRSWWSGNPFQVFSPIVICYVLLLSPESHFCLGSMLL